MLVPGTRLGNYEIVSALGAGGMGEVYRARDIRLKRDVALKILPESFATDSERVARFQREAEVLASLNHPRIAAIYGLEGAGGTTALVMELVEGPTLADRIAPGPIPVDEALPIAKQIAEALEAAHEQGIIHRDLKPANIKVRPDGTVKVLDFGLAKALDPSTAASADATASPTITSPAMTHRGVILGTAAYMSPEQARGKTVDRRSDIWAFGCVLYEMLTGRQAFAGETISDTIVAILSREPDLSLLPNHLGSEVRALLTWCLQKDPGKRLPHIGVARLDVVVDRQTDRRSAADSTSASAWSRTPAAIAAAVIVTALIGGVVGWIFRDGPEPQLIRLDISTPPTSSPLSFAISPDGRNIVFAAISGGAPRLLLRSLAAGTFQPLMGTEGGRLPFWSPDSRSIAFFADGALKRVDLESNSTRIISAQASPDGGAWNRDGVILFRRALVNGPLFRTSPDGGDPVQVTTLKGHNAHSYPHFLSDQHHFLFHAAGPPETRGLYLGSLDSDEIIRLTNDGSSRASSVLGDWILWTREDGLHAQRLDLTTRSLIGSPVTLAADVDTVSASMNGVIAYRGAPTVQRQLRWFSRDGIELGPLGAVEDVSVINGAHRLSPDDRRVALRRIVQGNEDVWILDGARMVRNTFDPAGDGNPVWSPDGGRLVFRSNRSGVQNLYLKPASGGGPETLLLDTSSPKIPSDWSADGRFILFHALDPKTDQDLWVLPLENPRQPFLLLKTQFNERHAQLSGDGKWVAYMSNASGRSEIYVRPFGASAAKSEHPTAEYPDGAISAQWQISTNGGIFPRWSRDGREVYFISPNGHMTAVPIIVNGTALEPGNPIALFETRIIGGGEDIGQGPMFDVSRDGRFLINTELTQTASPITILLNWRPESQ